MFAPSAAWSRSARIRAESAASTTTPSISGRAANMARSAIRSAASELLPGRSEESVRITVLAPSGTVGRLGVAAKELRPGAQAPAVASTRRENGAPKAPLRPTTRA
ncbi:unannotated protein [freshwater metagenome]|uniref:Unannotated protein n=1 Tax=freshwater metagenome TaxID=449393 RepID=A0A6J6PEZ7_9ZZZZ